MSKQVCNLRTDQTIDGGDPAISIEQWTLFKFRISWDFQGRYYAYRFGEATDIEPRNELKIPASRPASAGTPVRLLFRATCVCLLSASIAALRRRRQRWPLSTTWPNRELWWKVVYVLTYGECPNPCRTRSRACGARRGVCEATAASCARCSRSIPIVACNEHCPRHRQEESSHGNCIQQIQLNKPLMAPTHARLRYLSDIVPKQNYMRQRHATWNWWIK